MTLESLLHAGDSLTREQKHILRYMLNQGYKSYTITSRGTRKYSYK